MSGPSFLAQVGQMCLHRSENWWQRQTDTYDIYIGALGDRKMKEKKLQKNRPSPCSTQNVLKSATVHNEGSMTHARCRPACRALERRRRCGHQGRIFHISNTLYSQTNEASGRPNNIWAGLVPLGPGVLRHFRRPRWIE